MSTLRVNFVELENAATRYQQQAAQMLETCKQLTDKLEGFLAVYQTDTNGSRVAFDAAKVQCDQAVRRIADLGVAIAGATKAGNNHMQEAEYTNVAALRRADQRIV